MEDQALKLFVERLRARGNEDIADGYEDKTERGTFDLAVADYLERIHACLLEMYESDGESAKAFMEAPAILWPERK